MFNMIQYPFLVLNFIRIIFRGMSLKKDPNYYKQVFGRDCSSLVGYNDKTLEFIIQDFQGELIIPERAHEIKILGIKQIEKEKDILANILNVLQVSPREMVILDLWQ